MSASLFLFCAVIAADNPPLSTSTDASGRIKAIVSVLEAQEVRREPVYIHYRLTEYRSSQLDRAIRPNADPRNLVDRQFTRQYELALKGTRSYLKSDGPFNLSPAAAQTEAPSVWVFDGHSSYQRFADQYAVSSHRQTRGPMTPWDVTGEKQFLRGLRQWVAGDLEQRGKKVVFTVQDEKGPSGEGLVRVEIVSVNKSTPSPTKAVLWLQPKLEYAVWKEEQYNGKGAVTQRRDQCVYEVHGDKVYPRSAVWTVLHPKDDGQKATVLQRVELKVDRIETNPENIPDALFQLDMPRDQPVYDLDTKTRLVDPAAIQEHLDQLSADLPARRGKRWWPAVVTLATLAVVLIGLGAWWWRRKPVKPAR